MRKEFLPRLPFIFAQIRAILIPRQLKGTATRAYNVDRFFVGFENEANSRDYQTIQAR